MRAASGRDRSTNMPSSFETLTRGFEVVKLLHKLIARFTSQRHAYWHIPPNRMSLCEIGPVGLCGSQKEAEISDSLTVRKTFQNLSSMKGA